jgi:phosphatidylglycerol:prolipoprotein diacylglycerol transferase
VLESPREFLANPAMLFSRFGFTWFGGFLGGVVVLVFLARRFHIPVLEFLDLSAAPAALGYALGRMGCLLSGDGDYGVPTNLPWGMSFPNGIVPTTDRVHPTPIYEFLAWVIIAVFLWRLGKKAPVSGGSSGGIFGAYLVLTGIARFLVEFIRINPKVLYWMTNAQVVSILSILFGAILLWRDRSGAVLRSRSV